MFANFRYSLILTDSQISASISILYSPQMANFCSKYLIFDDMIPKMLKTKRQSTEWTLHVMLTFL